MSLKTSFYVSAFIGSLIGGWIPTLFGASFLSFSSILFSGIGGVLGIILVYFLSNR